MQAPTLQRVFFLGVLAVSAVLAALVAYPYAITLVVAAVLAVMFDPVHRWFVRGMRSETLAATSTVVLIVLVFLVPLVFFGGEAAREGLQVYASLALPEGLTSTAASAGIVTVHDLIAYLPAPFARFIPDVSIPLAPVLSSVATHAVSGLVALVGAITGTIIGFVIMLISTFYFLRDGRRFMRLVSDAVPLKNEYNALIGQKLHRAAISVVRGTLLVALGQGIVAGLSFWFFAVPHAALWGAATVVASLVPIVGPLLTLLPAVAYLALVGNLPAALGLLLWTICFVGLVDSFIRPHLITRTSQLHPLLVLLSVLGGLSVFGPAGFLVGPLVLSFFLALLELTPVLLAPPVASRRIRSVRARS